MANILSQEKANAIASAYLTNGYKKTAALLSVGYKTTYANSNIGLKLFDNVRVKEAINRIQTASKANTQITVQGIQQEHERLQQLAEAKGDLATATSNLIARGKTVGAYIEKQQVENMDNQKLTDNETEALKDLASGYTRKLAIKTV